MPSRLLLPPVTSHLALVRQIAAKDGHNAAHRRRLVSLLSETAALAAWLYMDVDDRAAVRRHYQFAVKAAERSGHPLLPAYMLASMGQFAATCGDAVDGLRLVAAARQRLARSAPPIATIWLDCTEALAMAEARNRQALAKLEHAEARIARATTDEPVWPWIFRFDNRKLAGFRAQAATALGQHQIANAALRDAYDAQRPSRGRPWRYSRPKPWPAAGVWKRPATSHSPPATSDWPTIPSGCSAQSHASATTLARGLAGLPRSLDERLFSIYREDT